MGRPVVVLIDPDGERRDAICHGLAGAGYEVVPVPGSEDARRFADGLDKAVVVAPGDLPEVVDASLFQDVAKDRPVVLLGAPTGDGSLHEDFTILPMGAGLTPLDIARKLHLILIGREVRLDVDSRCEALVGDLSLTPLPELLRDLAEASFSGRLDVERGVIVLTRGEVAAVSAGEAEGVKAFCRLARLHTGPCHLTPRPLGGNEGGQHSGDEVERRLTDSLEAMLVAAIEDSTLEFPDPRTRVEVDIAAALATEGLSVEQQRIARIAQNGTSLREILDSSPERDVTVMDDLLHLADSGVARIIEPELAVVVVTDSTADLPAHIAHEHGITVIPLGVRFGERAFRDGVDLDPRRFYEMLAKKDAVPSTRPPASAEFLACYDEHLEQHDVVSVHISGKLSDTAAEARKASKAALGKVTRNSAHVEIFDSGMVSGGLGCTALFAARMAARGESAPAIRARLEDMAPRFHTLFIVDTLDYLVRGGRVGKARGLVGKLLGIKPILGMRDGEVVAVDQARGGKAAQHKLLQLMDERFESGRPTIAAIAHAKAPAWADRLHRLLGERFEIRESMVAEIGPVVGTHVGPGTVGLAIFQPTDEEESLLAPLADHP